MPSVVVPFGFDRTQPDLSEWCNVRAANLEYCLQLKLDSPAMGEDGYVDVFHACTPQGNAALRERFSIEDRFVVPEGTEFLMAAALLRADLGNADQLIWHSLNTLRLKASRLSNLLVAARERTAAAFDQAKRGE